jgi:3-oxoacyl-[acyl-carrier-protein] synthase II
MKRVVVTGLGIVSPVGNDLEQSWSAIVRGQSGIGTVTAIDLSNEPVKIGGEVKGFEAAKYMSEKEARRSQRFVQFACAASRMALDDARLVLDDTNQPDVGVSIGVGVGGMGYMEEQIGILQSKGGSRVSPFTIPGFIANMAAGMVSIETGAKGPNICPTTACTSGTHAIGEALILIQTGRARAMIAGGAEAAISALPYAGFSKMKALSSNFNETPEKASRPFDAARSGFVMGEGAGVLILEELEHALARGAKIYCELAGYGMSSDAFHMTSPSPGGEGAVRCMAQALRTAGLAPEDIDYINAHGTSTEANDANETAAIKTLFGEHARSLNISSTKSMTGHLLGAAGGVEAVFTVMAIKTGVIPPTINYENPDPACDLNYTPNQSVQRPVRAALSNSFGFGGTNGCIAFKRFDRV